ncbi:hypothetical protein LZ30DRAFT_609894, partial [Colletotrichum cereale]
ITEDVIKATAKNRQSSYKTIVLLLKKRRDNIYIIEDIILIIIRSFNYIIIS